MRREGGACAVWWRRSRLSRRHNIALLDDARDPNDSSDAGSYTSGVPRNITPFSAYDGDSPRDSAN